GEPNRLPVLVRSSLGFSNGRGLPFISASFGFGSKRSTCDGPPAMNRQIARVARAGNIGARTSSGDGAANVSRENSDARPSMPNPLANRPSICRRDSKGLVHIDEFVRAKKRLAKRFPPVRL